MGKVFNQVRNEKEKAEKYWRSTVDALGIYKLQSFPKYCTILTPVTK